MQPNKQAALCISMKMTIHIESYETGVSMPVILWRYAGSMSCTGAALGLIHATDSGRKAHHHQYRVMLARGTNCRSTRVYTKGLCDYR